MADQPVPSWRKVLISGSNAAVNELTASALIEDNNTNHRVVVFDTTSGAFRYTGSYGTGGGGGGNPGGSDTQIQFNDSNGFGGSSALTFNKSTTNPLITLKATSGGGNNPTLLITGSSSGNSILHLKSLRPHVRFSDDDGSPSFYFLQNASNLVIGTAGSAAGPITFTPSSGLISSSGAISASNASFGTFGAENEIVLVGPDTSITSSNAISIDSAGNVGIGTSSPAVRLHMVGEGNQTSQFRMDQYNNDQDAPDFRIKRARGTEASPSDVIAGDYLFRINVEGYSGSAFETYGSMQFDVDDADPDAMVWNIETKDSTSVVANRLTIDKEGHLSASGDLAINGINNVSASIASAASSGAGTLQQVTDAGAVTTTAITSSTIKVVESGQTFITSLGGLLTLQYDDSTTNVKTGMPSAADTHHLNLVNTNTTTNTYTAINFRSDNADGRIAYVQESTSNTGHFTFITDDVGTKEVIRIEANGDLNVLEGNISSSGELSAATVTGFISADGDNRVLTSDGDGTLTAEDTLTYNGTTFALQTQNIDMQASEGGFDLTGNITASGNISASGDLSINGIPDVSASIADAAGSGGGGVVTSYTNGANNRVITSTGTSGINGESGLIFNGSVLDVGVNSSNRITLSGGNGTLGTTSNLTIGNNSTNTNVNALLQFAAKSGGYYAGSFVNTDDTTSTFSTNGRHVGEFIDVPTAASVTAGKIVYYRSTTTAWSPAQANTEASATPLLGMAVDTATTTRAMVRGYIRVAASDIGGPAPTLGELLYLSTGSAGTFQTLVPSTAGHIARSVGYTIQSVGGRGGISAYVVYFNPSNDYVKL